MSHSECFASLSMLMGYGLLAVPTIVGTMEVSELKRMESKPLAPTLPAPISSELPVMLRCRASDCAAWRTKRRGSPFKSTS